MTNLDIPMQEILEEAISYCINKLKIDEPGLPEIINFPLGDGLDYDRYFQVALYFEGHTSETIYKGRRLIKDWFIWTANPMYRRYVAGSEMKHALLFMKETPFFLAIDTDSEMREEYGLDILYLTEEDEILSVYTEMSSEKIYNLIESSIQKGELVSDISIKLIDEKNDFIREVTETPLELLGRGKAPGKKDAKKHMEMKHFLEAELRKDIAKQVMDTSEYETVMVRGKRIRINIYNLHPDIASYRNFFESDEQFLKYVSFTAETKQINPTDLVLYDSIITNFTDFMMEKYMSSIGE